MTLKQSLHNLLADNNLDELIKELRSITEGGTSLGLQREIEQLSVRHAENVAKNKVQAADDVKYNQEDSKIKYALLSIINRLPNVDNTSFSFKSREVKIWGAIAGGILLVGGIVYMLLTRVDTPVSPSITPTPIVKAPLPIVKIDTLPKIVIDSPKIAVDTVKIDTMLKKKRKRRTGSSMSDLIDTPLQ